MTQKTDIIKANKAYEENEARLSRYSGIISAIEFFSQRFELEQLMTYAFEFCNDLIEPDKMALWFHHDDAYVQFSCKGYTHNFAFEHQDHYNQIVYFHAGLLYEKQIVSLLPAEIQKHYAPDFCIPLVMDKDFFGFIAVKRSKKRPFNVEDEIVASALMNLYTTALTNYHSYKLLENTKTQLDEKIFNLFAMNQSTKALLSILSLKSLCDLAISVFSELTQSSFTTFFMKDQKSENYQLMGFKNVKAHNLDLQITLFPDKDKISMLPVLLDMSKKKSVDLFVQYFFNGIEIIEKINPQYIVLLKKGNELIGFVTLGAKVNDTVYDNSVFELVESLASATYIAIKNAIYIEEIEEQKKLIHSKLNELIRLNQLMKNMNSARTHEQVIALVMNTLNVSFGIEMGFFALYDEEEKVFNISSAVNIKNSFKKLKQTNALLPLFEGETILVYEEEKVKEYFTKSTLNAFIKEPSGLIMVPVYIKNIDVQLIGFIALLNHRSSVLISDEALVSYEAIATHIAPVIHQLHYAEKIKQLYQPDYASLFLDHLKLQIKEALEFSLDLFVIYIHHQSPVHFKATALFTELQSGYKNVYPIDKRNTFIYTNDDLVLTDILSQLEKYPEYNCSIYTLGKEFKDYNTFFQLFES